jgi:hypothetical protein
MKSTFKRDLSAAIFGFIAFSAGSVYILFDDAPSRDTKVQFLTVTIGLSLLFGLGVIYLISKKRR